MSSCPSCESEKYYCGIHQQREIVRNTIAYSADFDRDPRTVTEEEIDYWFENNEFEINERGGAVE